MCISVCDIKKEICIQQTLENPVTTTFDVQVDEYGNIFFDDPANEFGPIYVHTDGNLSGSLSLIDRFSLDASNNLFFNNA